MGYVLKPKHVMCHSCRYCAYETRRVNILLCAFSVWPVEVMQLITLSSCMIACWWVTREFSVYISHPYAKADFLCVLAQELGVRPTTSTYCLLIMVRRGQ